MNHNLGVRLEQGQFIEIRKVSGTARSEARMLSVSFFKKYFDGVQVGDFVYFTKFGKETYIITKNHILNGQDLRRYYLVLKQL